MSEYEDLIPQKADDLFKKISKKKMWASIYLYVCRKITESGYDTTTIKSEDLRRDLKMNRWDVYTYLDILVGIGYVEKVKKANRFVLYIPVKSFSKADYIKAANKTMGFE